MLPICYDPYSGTLGRFQRAEIFQLVADAGYEGINLRQIWSEMEIR